MIKAWKEAPESDSMKPAIISQEDSALQILREFVADVLAVHANDPNEAFESTSEEWPDLAITFRSAYELIERSDS
jgi:hypothetical protein